MLPEQLKKLDLKMKLELEDNEYYLVENNQTIATTDKLLLKEDPYMKKLSRKNCDNIINNQPIEIETEPYVKYVSPYLETIYPPLGERNKLDENGCLILKKR